MIHVMDRKDKSGLVVRLWVGAWVERGGELNHLKKTKTKTKKIREQI